MTKSAPIHDSLPAKLVDGYQKFKTGRLKQEQDRFRHLSEHGQKPPALLIGCCDSRVAPEVIFDAGPGEIFVVRNIAALVPPFDPDCGPQETSAAIEYAGIALKVAHIVVMGHEKCGGIRAFAQGKTDEFKPLSAANFVAKWKALVQPAADRLGPQKGDLDQYCENLCQASIIQGIANLRSYPWVKAREEAGDLTLHGAYFGVADGRMLVLDQTKRQFVPLLDAAA